MKTSEAGRAFIARYEGVVLKAYPDPATGGEPLTIGVGHTSRAGLPKVVRGMTITRDEAIQILGNDLARVFEPGVVKALKVPFTQVEFDAMVSLAFNIGVGAFAGSTLVRRFNAGDRAGAADAFLVWTKAAGHVLSGLVTRRRAERDLFLSKAGTIVAPAALANDAGESTGVMLRTGAAFPEAVRALQSDLRSVGYDIRVDGDFGAATEKVVCMFQIAHGLTADGKAGPATRSALAAEVAARGKFQAVAYLPVPGEPVTELTSHLAA